MILDENDQGVGTVWLGLIGGNDNSRAMSSNDGSFSFLPSYGDYEDELKLSYNFPNDSPYESGSVILSQCQGSIIRVKKIVPDDSDDSGEYKRNLCGKSCSDNPKRCEDSSGGCTICTYRYNPLLTKAQSWHCEKPEAKEAEKTEGLPKEQQAKEAGDKLDVSELAPQINKIVNYSMGIGGIIAFLLIVFGGFQIILSAGNPERVKAGKEMITSAIAGLLLIIFAVFILRLIGYDILKIPGFKP